MKKLFSLFVDPTEVTALKASVEAGILRSLSLFYSLLSITSRSIYSPFLTLCREGRFLWKFYQP